MIAGMASGGLVRSLAVPLAALAALAGCALLHGILHGAEERGSLQAEASRLAAIAQNERQVVEVQRVAAEATAIATADLHDRVNQAKDDARDAKRKLAHLREAQVERGDRRICARGCLLEFPNAIGQDP